MLSILIAEKTGETRRVDFDKEEERAKLVPAVLAMAKDPAAAKAKAAKAREFVMNKFAASMAVVRQQLPG